MYLVVYKCQLNSTYSNQSQCRELMISSKKGDISAACDDPQNRKLAESQAADPYVSKYRNFVPFSKKMTGGGGGVARRAPSYSYPTITFSFYLQIPQRNDTSPFWKGTVPTSGVTLIIFVGR